MICLSIHVSPLLKKSASAAAESSRGMAGCFGTTFVPDLDNGSNQKGVILVDIIYHLRGLLSSNSSNHFLVYDRVDPAYVNILEQCNIGTTTTIQLFDKKLHIPIEKGVRQGDTISPKLFTSALQYAMSRLNRDGKGLTIDGKKLSNLRFADDIVLISDNTPEMNQLLNELNEAGKAIGLK
ncbi:hypothetical protein ANCCEY_04995 [Ancylostoma ceylanicum]|uniref:Reverse transcriptase domain-containing protein n=1 Tax=Ancylostoma ceylanicum TaxID=53326 RepID=A0A0D6LV16_9BILA|nr:hypothetical protein ANCCEY_04995 [Ancylostoma ceylanicum]